MPSRSTTLSRSHNISCRGQSYTCRYDKCTVSLPKEHIIVHEVDEHLWRRFFCPYCKTRLASFESLRTHVNSQHLRTRRFSCEVCHTTYLDPARLAKCRKRHQGQYRCPQCDYFNARVNSVVKHMKSQHNVKNVPKARIHFDTTLGNNDAPRARRGSASVTSPATSRPSDRVGSGATSLTDAELFQQSEDERRRAMEALRLEHAEWLGGVDALNSLVPTYPLWQPRDHPYGRIPSPNFGDIPALSSSYSNVSSSVTASTTPRHQISDDVALFLRGTPAVAEGPTPLRHPVSPLRSSPDPIPFDVNPPLYITSAYSMPMESSRSVDAPDLSSSPLSDLSDVLFPPPLEDSTQMSSLGTPTLDDFLAPQSEGGFVFSESHSIPDHRAFGHAMEQYYSATHDYPPLFNAPNTTHFFAGTSPSFSSK